MNKVAEERIFVQGKEGVEIEPATVALVCSGLDTPWVGVSQIILNIPQEVDRAREELLRRHDRECQADKHALNQIVYPDEMIMEENQENYD